MKTAYLYIRVSTDEQAIKGYSQRNQEERLVRFCTSHDIVIYKCVWEDYSAKTFNRPAWSSMMKEIRTNKRLRPDLILFTKWDRFSRNTGDAYYMIAQLLNLGITPQAIDQELDLNIPENKIILGVYLATSEAENDRRSMNVKQGINRANKEGRWTARAPLGYKVHIMADHKRLLYPSEPQASLIQQAFALVLENNNTTQAIYHQLIEKGLECSISHFARILRNPVYCGKIIVRAFENEATHLVKGLHDALVDETVFDSVQEILDNKKRRPDIARKREDGFLFLRGFFRCPECGKFITGSVSTGKSGRKYHYYHCMSPCGFRLRTDKMNECFITELGKLEIDTAYLAIYKDLLRFVDKKRYASNTTSRNNHVSNVNKLIERIIKVKELLLKGEIEEDDFMIIKKDCELQINRLGTSLQQSDWIERRIENDLKRRQQQLSNLANTFNNCNLQKRKKLLGMLINPQAILSIEMQLSTILKTDIGRLFGLENVEDDNTVREERNYSNSIEWNDQLLDKFLPKIMAITGKQECPTQKSTAFKILAFLMEYEKITEETPDSKSDKE